MFEIGEALGTEFIEETDMLPIFEYSSRIIRALFSRRATS